MRFRGFPANHERSLFIRRVLIAMHRRLNGPELKVEPLGCSVR